MHLCCFFFLVKIVAIYALLVCKIFNRKIRSCKFFDKYQVWEDDQHDIGEDDQHDVMSFTIKKRCQRGHSDIARMAYCQEMMISNDIHVVDDTVRSLFDVMVMMR